MFTRPDGSPIHPGYASTRFRLLMQRSDLPPIRLHDLRHGAASLAHQAGADLKTLQDLLGHSSIVITADTCTSVLPLARRRRANATANLVLNAARKTRKKIKIKARRNRPGNPRKTGAPRLARPAAVKKPQVGVARPDPQSRRVTAPSWHPRDTHRPWRTHQKGRQPAVSRGYRPYDLARPKRFELPTF